jgi:hypothetical protein
MNLALWIATGLLAGVALVAGISKTFVPKEKLAEQSAGNGPNTPASASSRPLGSLNSWLRLA